MDIEFKLAQRQFNEAMEERIFPMESAYYYYKKKENPSNAVSFDEFYDTMEIGINGEYSLIMDAYKQPRLDVNEIIITLSYFFKEDQLIDVDGNVIATM